MALTKHQEVHLEAMKKEAKENRQKTKQEKDKLADDKGIPRGQYDNYLNLVETDVDAVISSKTFPVLENDCDIHDHFEKDRTDV